jgi:hypothetical protein
MPAVRKRYFDGRVGIQFPLKHEGASFDALCTDSQSDKSSYTHCSYFLSEIPGRDTRQKAEVVCFVVLLRVCFHAWELSTLALALVSPARLSGEVTIRIILHAIAHAIQRESLVRLRSP